MPDLVIVSNRGPVSFRLDDQGRLQRTEAGGGLAGTLGPLLAGSGATWVAASMNEADRQATEAGLMGDEGLHLVTLAPDAEVYRMAYDVISNATLWFCHHHLFDLSRRPRLDRRWQVAWEGYRALNRQFAEAVAGAAPEGAEVLVQDYHLALTGRMLAERRPDLRTVHFSHTPFGDPSSLRVLPTAAGAELLDGMAGFGACGFHTERWAAAFRACFDDAELRGAREQAPHTFVAPLGPDPDAVAPRRVHRRLPGGGVGTRRADRRSQGDRPGRPGRALQEHPPGPVGVRGTARDPSGVAGAGGPADARLPVPGGAGRVPGLPQRGRAHGGPDQRDVGAPRVDAGPAAGGRRPPPVGGGAAALRRAAREPAAGRDEPGGQGGSTAQPDRRGPRALPGGRARGRSCGGWRSG